MMLQQACQVTLIGSVTHSFHCLHTLTLVSEAFVTYHTHSADLLKHSKNFKLLYTELYT